MDQQRFMNYGKVGGAYNLVSTTQIYRKIKGPDLHGALDCIAGDPYNLPINSHRKSRAPKLDNGGLN